VKTFFSFFWRFIFGILLMAVIFGMGIWSVSWSIGKYNQYEFGKRINNQIEVSRITYYLSPNGNDANDGKSIETAWQTIEKVNQTDFKPADQILFEGGKTFTGNLIFESDDLGTPESPIKISSYGDGRAIIQANDRDGIKIHNSMGFEISNLIIAGSGSDANQGSGIGVVNDLRGDVKLENIKINLVETKGFGGHGIIIDGNEGKSGFRKVLIEDVESHDNGIGGVYVYGLYSFLVKTYAHENITIRRVKSFNNSGKKGEWLENSGSGIVLSDVDGGIIENSIAYHNGWLCDSKMGGPVGIWAWDSNNIIIQHNESYSNKTGGKKDGGGFDLDGGVRNSVMQYNYSHDNEGAGYLVMQFTYGREWTNNVVRYNISENDGRKNNYAGIHVWGDAKNAFIYNNTVITSEAENATPRGIVFRPNDDGSNLFPKNIKVVNNIFVTNGNTPIIESALEEETITFQNNNYFSNDSNWQIIWNKDTFQSLKDWSEKTGQERKDNQFVGLSVNPNFTDCSTKTNFFTKAIAYCLKPDSPLIDNGSDLKKSFQIETGDQDFRGLKTPVTNYEIGAFEVAK
jgi:hypothetical protein